MNKQTTPNEIQDRIEKALRNEISWTSEPVLLEKGSFETFTLYADGEDRWGSPHASIMTKFVGLEKDENGDYIGVQQVVAVDFSYSPTSSSIENLEKLIWQLNILKQIVKSAIGDMIGQIFVVTD